MQPIQQISFSNRQLPKIDYLQTKDLALDLALERAYDLALCLIKNPDIKQILNFSFALEFKSNLVVSPDLKPAIDILKQQLPDLAQGKEHLLTWWSTNGNDWVDRFRQVINKYRYLNLSWDFNPDRQQLLHKYYTNNQFLLQFIDSNLNLTITIKDA